MSFLCPMEEWQGWRWSLKPRPTYSQAWPSIGCLIGQEKADLFKQWWEATQKKNINLLLRIIKIRIQANFLNNLLKLFILFHLVLTNREIIVWTFFQFYDFI